MGSPGWRLAYNRGLLAEEDGDAGSAIQQYRFGRRPRALTTSRRAIACALEAGGLGLAAALTMPGTTRARLTVASMQPTDDGSMWIEVPATYRPGAGGSVGSVLFGCVDAGTPGPRPSPRRPATTAWARRPPALPLPRPMPPTGHLPVTSLPTESKPAPEAPAVVDDGPPIPDARSLGLDEQGRPVTRSPDPPGYRCVPATRVSVADACLGAGEPPPRLGA
ncbi:MAG: hypothetical protein R3E85_07585 [Planctomycetota bacterium]